ISIECEADGTSAGTGTWSQFIGRGETGSHRIGTGAEANGATIDNAPIPVMGCP
ncbi:hypothetical protein KI387_029702, partial [Taxus chinensis]